MDESKTDAGEVVSFNLDQFKSRHPPAGAPAARSTGPRKRKKELVGAPLAFMADVCRLTKGRAALAVALLVYRRTHVLGRRVVTLAGAELDRVGVTRWQRARALRRLAAAGLLRIETMGPGQAAEVTLLWCEPES